MKFAISFILFLLIYDALGVLTAWICGKFRCFFSCEDDDTLGMLCIVLWPFVLPIAIATAAFQKGARH